MQGVCSEDATKKYLREAARPIFGYFVFTSSWTASSRCYERLVVITQDYVWTRQGVIVCL